MSEDITLRLSLAKHLIRQDKLAVAKKMLMHIHDTNNLEALYVLSLLHRYDDEYDLEAQIIAKILEIDHTDVYAKERFEWQCLSPFEKHEARPPLNLPDNPLYIPKQETLDQLCFVTGGDSNYFEYIVECIESIKNEKRYQNANVCVIDTGLTTEEIQYLYQKLNVTRVVDPGWNLNFDYMRFKAPCGINMKKTKEEARCYQFIMNAVFAHETFPEYEYFFVIQPDDWVHDSRYLDRMIKVAEENGLCRSHMNVKTNWPDHFFKTKSIPIPELALPYTHTEYFAITSPACMNKENMKKNAEIYKAFVAENGLFLGYEELSATVLLNNHPNMTNCSLSVEPYYGLHCLKNNTRCLIYQTGELVTFYHIDPNNKTHSQKKNRNDRDQDNFYAKVPIFNSKDEYVLSPVRFRCHPWRDKEEIKNMLTKLSGENHEF